jgi:hypothetical protein
VSGYNAKVYREQGGNKMVVASGGEIEFESGSVLTLAGHIANDNIARVIRKRFTAAEVNSGATVLPAIPGYKYRMHDCAMIAIGGAAATATSVDLLGTKTTSRKLVANAVAGLTQSAVLRAGATNSTVLADGESFTANDANTAITIGKTGSNLATATHIDVLLTYSIEAE